MPEGDIGTRLEGQVPVCAGLVFSASAGLWAAAVLPWTVQQVFDFGRGASPCSKAQVLSTVAGLLALSSIAAWQAARRFRCIKPKAWGSITAIALAMACAATLAIRPAIAVLLVEEGFSSSTCIDRTDRHVRAYQLSPELTLRSLRTRLVNPATRHGALVSISVILTSYSDSSGELPFFLSLGGTHEFIPLDAPVVSAGDDDGSCETGPGHRFCDQAALGIAKLLSSS